MNRGKGQRPRLLDQVRSSMRVHRYSRRTEEAYVHWIRRFMHFSGKRHPAKLDEAEVSRFLTSLAMDGRVSASTQSQAASALLFLYRKVLGVDLRWLDRVVRASAPRRLPVVLTREEVGAVLAHLAGTKRLVVMLLYGSGLRLLECRACA